MHVTLRQMRVFEAVARHLSYTRAAEELFLTQPAVSMQIKQLEGNVGLPLFEQLGKRLHLTDAGREMLACSRAIARQLKEVEEIIEDMKGVRRGRLHVAVASTAGYFATRLLAAFAREHEGVTISLDITNRERLLQELADNETDLAIMGQPPEEYDLEATAFMQNPLVVIAAPDHPLARRKKIPLKGLQAEPFVVRERGSGTRTAMEQFFSDKGVTLRSDIEMSSNEAIKQSVQAGLGLGIVSLHTLELELEARRLVVLNVAGFPIQRHWYIVHRKGKRLSPVAAVFHQFVLNRAADVWQRPLLQAAPL